MSEREECVYRSKLAEQAERYEDMVEWMQKVAEMDQEMTVEERNLLSVAYKNVIGTKRASWRIIAGIEQKEFDGKKNDSKHAAHIAEYKKKIESELKCTCMEVLAVIKAIVEKQGSSIAGESKVFYYKMQGDYYRYLAEFAKEQERKGAAEQSLVAYREAKKISDAELVSTHPIRLGLALNFSVFYYEILNSADRACTTAKTAFDEAIQELDSLSEESYKDSTLIMQLLRDNLTLWTADMSKDGEDDNQRTVVQDVEQEQDDS